MDELILEMRDVAKIIKASSELDRIEDGVAVQLAIMAEKAADELEKRRWIPVEERLPENHELVIWWLVPNIGKKYGFAFPSTFDEKKGIPETATHWMSLPEGPKEDKP